MKKLFIFILASVFCFGLFAAGPDIPIIEDSEQNIDISDRLNYINNSCTNSYSIYAIKDKKNNVYSIMFSNTSCITDISIHLGFSFKNEKLFNTYLKTIDTLDLEKCFEQYRMIFLKEGIEPKNYYSLDRHKVEMQLYEYYIY